MPNQMLGQNEPQSPNAKKTYSFGQYQAVLKVLTEMAAEESRRARREVTVSELSRRITMEAANDYLLKHEKEPLTLNVKSDAWRSDKERKANRRGTKGTAGSLAEMASALVKALQENGVIPTAKKDAEKAA